MTFNPIDTPFNKQLFRDTNSQLYDLNSFCIWNCGNTFTQNEFQIDSVENSYFDKKITTLDNYTINCPNDEKKTKNNSTEEKLSRNKESFSPESLKLFNYIGNKQNMSAISKSKYTQIEKLNKSLYPNEVIFQLGRKRKAGDTKVIHDKYAKDNIERKIKSYVLNFSLQFLNQKIKYIYNEKIGNGVFKKQLLPIHQSIKSNMTIEFNRNLLNKTLGEIFSGNITNKYSIYFNNHNKKIIDLLLNDPDKNKVLYFKRLFDITFLECIQKFSGKSNIKELEGFQLFSEIKKEISDEPEYIKFFEYYLNNYKNIILSKKRRKSWKEKEE
jgi:hypothetical protein